LGGPPPPPTPPPPQPQIPNPQSPTFQEKINSFLFKFNKNQKIK